MLFSSPSTRFCALFSAMRSSAARFAAYYKVSVTLLEPEPARSRSGRVLLYGVLKRYQGSGLGSAIALTLLQELRSNALKIGTRR